MKQPLHYKPAWRIRIRPWPWEWVMIQLGYREYEYRWVADRGYVLLQTIDGNMAQIPRWKWERAQGWNGIDRE